MEMRLQKFLANAGINSRRKCEQLILDGKVSVNDKIVTELGMKIDSNQDKIEYMNKIIRLKNEYVYLMLNKPIGYITTVSDEKGRKTVMDLIDETKRVYPIGRLDCNTSGMILLTNDGELTHKLTHPKHEVNKRYIAGIRGIPTEDKLDELRRGIKSKELTTSKASIRVMKTINDISEIEVIIHEGKNRQVRRMFEHIGYYVVKLKRVGIGKLRLNHLPIGKYKSLTQEEVKYLKTLN